MSETNRDKYFETSKVQSDLKDKSIRGGLFTISGQMGAFAVQLVSSITLARLLTPNDYGLIGMSVVLMNFATLFRDMGLNMAVIQKKDVTHNQVSTLFWLQLGICIILGILVALTAPLIAWFYGEPRLVMVTLVLSITFVLSGLNLQYSALLARQMRFGMLSIIRISGALVGMICAITAACLGWQYWALVVQMVLPLALATVLYRVMCRWRPSLPQKNTGIRGFLRFGGHLTGFNMLNYFSRNADKILIGKYLPIEQLGFYNKAYELLMLPLRQVRDPVYTVAIPALSRVQDDPVRYKRAFMSFQEKMCLVMIYPIAILTVGSDWIIEFVLGAKWLPASEIFSWLSITAILQALLSGLGLLFISQGRTKEMFALGLFDSITTVASFTVGIRWGVIGVAKLYFISSLIKTPICIWYAGRRGHVSAKEIVRSISPFAVSVIILTGFLYALRMTLPILNSGVGIAILVSASLVYFAGCLIVSSSIRGNLVELAGWIKPYFSRKKRCRAIV